MTDPFFGIEDSDRIVYIRTIDTADIPEARASGITAEHLYAIHDARGNRLAVLTDRAAAFVVARQHAMTPVSVH